MAKGFPTIESRPIASGMHKGSHTRAAIVLTAVAGVFLLIPFWSNFAVIVLFLAGAVGLLGEVTFIVSTGELTARKGRFGPYIAIRRAEHPAHFWFHVCAYALLGVFCLAIAIGGALSVLLKHAA